MMYVYLYRQVVQKGKMNGGWFVGKIDVQMDRGEDRWISGRVGGQIYQRMDNGGISRWLDDKYMSGWIEVWIVEWMDEQIVG